MGWLYPLLLVGAVALSGCGDIILIGYRCADGAKRCSEALSETDGGSNQNEDGSPGDGGNGGMGENAADGASDGGGGDDASLDATRDAATDGGPGFEALVRNRSFELTAGSQGNLDDVSGTKIDPWNRCPNLFPDLEYVAVLDTGGLLGNLKPTEPASGGTFVRFSFLLSGFPFLTQRLETPWPAGETRALTFDVAGQSVFNELRMAFIGSTTDCPESAAREMLASTEVVQNGEWARDVCVEITPERDVEWLILHPEANIPSLLDGGGVTAQVYLDNLRESARCP